jgi:hypothetical protein
MTRYSRSPTARETHTTPKRLLERLTLKKHHLGKIRGI